jgi:hypothetical protein
MSLSKMHYKASKIERRMFTDNRKAKVKLYYTHKNYTTPNKKSIIGMIRQVNKKTNRHA